MPTTETFKLPTKRKNLFLRPVDVLDRGDPCVERSLEPGGDTGNSGFDL